MVMSKRWSVAIHMQIYCTQNIVGVIPRNDEPSAILRVIIIESFCKN